MEEIVSQSLVDSTWHYVGSGLGFIWVCVSFLPVSTSLNFCIHCSVWCIYGVWCLSVLHATFSKVWIKTQSHRTKANFCISLVKGHIKYCFSDSEEIQTATWVASLPLSFQHRAGILQFSSVLRHWVMQHHLRKWFNSPGPCSLPFSRELPDPPT